MIYLRLLDHDFLYYFGQVNSSKASDDVGKKENTFLRAQLSVASLEMCSRDGNYLMLLISLIDNGTRFLCYDYNYMCETILV